MGKNLILKRLLNLSKMFRIEKSYTIVLIVLFMTLMMALEFLSLYNDDFEKSINANVDNRTFKVAIPLAQEIEPVSTFFEKSEAVQSYDVYEDEDFNLHIVTFILRDYWQKEAIENQLVRVNSDVSFYGSNFDLESLMIFHFGSNLKVFLKVIIVFLVLMISLIFIKCNKVIKNDLFLLKALGYQKQQVFIILILRSLCTLVGSLIVALILEMTVVRNVLLFAISKEPQFSEIEIVWFLNIGNIIYLVLFFIALTILNQVVYIYKGDKI